MKSIPPLNRRELFIPSNHDSIYSQAMKVTLIHNPDAGDDQQLSADALLELICRAGHTARYQSSKDESWQSALEQPCDLVAVAGGDGIVGAVAKTLIGR